MLSYWITLVNRLLLPQPQEVPMPQQPGTYWCRFRSKAPGYNAIVFLAGQAPMLQVVGLQMIDESYSPRSRYLRDPDPSTIEFGPLITIPPYQPTPCQ